jgi:hypothetical protein
VSYVALADDALRYDFRAVPGAPRPIPLEAAVAERCR